MNLKEIVDLCKTGQAEQAYEEARQLMVKTTDDPHFAYVAMAYALKAMMAKAVASNDIDSLCEYLKEFGALRLEEEGETELNNGVAWEIRAMAIKWKEDGIFDPEAADKLLDAVMTIGFLKPHRYYSLILDAFLKLRDEKDQPWQRLPEVVAWWGLENLLPEDYKRVLMTNGKSIVSLAERAYTATLKILTEEVKDGRLLGAAESMLADLEALEQTHPEYDNILYRKSKLLKAMGNTDEALKAATAYARRRPGASFAWSALGDVVEDDRQKAACYSRALLCKTDPMFQVKVRYKLAVIMYNLGEYAHAKREFEKVAQIYASKGWHMPAPLATIRNQAWYLNTYEADSNRGFYHEFGRHAEKLTCSDIPETPVLINMVNPQKMICGYITADRKRGFFSMKKLGTRIAVNNIYMVRFDGEPGGEKAIKVVDIRKAENIADYQDVFFRRIEAEVGLRPGQSFQFVDDIYIDGMLVQGLPQDTPAEITAVIYYNIKKESWGWRAIYVHPISKESWKED